MSDLLQTLQTANDAYHNGKPIMTDDEFDALVAKWEAATGRTWSEIGAEPSSSDTIVTLPMWMGSMNKVKEEKDIVTWQKRWKPDRMVISDKLDGISCLLQWIPSRNSMKLYTRGNGQKGTDITPYIRMIESLRRMQRRLSLIPKKEQEYEYLIRGELIIPRDSWTTEQDTVWTRYTNPRNTVAGLVSRKPTSHGKDGLLALKRIECVPFSFDVRNRDGTWKRLSKSNMYEWLRTTFGIKQTVWFDTITVSDGLKKEHLSKILIERRESSPYEIDGIIVWDDAEFEPNSSGNPSRAFAFKMVMDDQKSETLVTDVEWNRSRTNVWKPVVLFEPVTIGNTRIGRATGHNAAWLHDRGIGVGSRIVIVRSGDVIPKIHEVIHRVSQKSIPMPPEGTWKWDAKRTDLVATDQTMLQVATQATYLVATLRIKSLSKRSLEKYAKTHTKAIECLPFPQMFPLIATKRDWLQVKGMKEKSATNFVERTEEAWQTADTVTRLISLGLLPRGIGMKQVESMQKQGILDAVLGLRSRISKQELQMILEGMDGWGATRVSSMVSALSKLQKGYAWALRNTHCNRAKPPASSKSPDIQIPPKLMRAIEGKPYILFTGFRNRDWQTYLETQHGKTLIQSISGKHTSENTIVVTKGTKSSSKVILAEQIGISVFRI